MTKKEKYILLSAVKFAKDKLSINGKFTLKLSDNRNGFETTGYYDPKNHIIAIYTKERKIYDNCRTAFHELVHRKQNEEGRLIGDIPNIGGMIEDEANAKAGSMLKEFAEKFEKENKINIYEL